MHTLLKSFLAPLVVIGTWLNHRGKKRLDEDVEDFWWGAIACRNCDLNGYDFEIKTDAVLDGLEYSWCVACGVHKPAITIERIDDIVAFCEYMQSKEMRFEPCENPGYVEFNRG